MNAQCNECRDWIAQDLFDQLDPACRQALQKHLETCPECQEEHGLLSNALAELKSYPEASPPRHFYVQEPAGRPGIWELFRQMSLGWRAAAASLLLGALLIGGTAASNLRVEASQGSLRLAFGQLPRQPEIDPDQLKADLARELNQQINQLESEWFQRVREEISRSAESLSEQQKQQMKVALSRVETRLAERMDQADLELDAGFKNAAAEIYRSLSREQQRQVALLNGRIDLLTLRGQIQGNQTEALMATVLQIADMNSNPGGVR